MDPGMLPDIKRGQMKAEGSYLPQQGIKKKACQTLAMIFAQASVQNFQICFEFAGRIVAILFAFTRVSQPHDDECKKAPVKFGGRNSSQAGRLFSHALRVFVQSL